LVIKTSGLLLKLRKIWMQIDDMNREIKYN